MLAGPPRGEHDDRTGLLTDPGSADFDISLWHYLAALVIMLGGSILMAPTWASGFRTARLTDPKDFHLPCVQAVNFPA